MDMGAKVFIFVCGWIVGLITMWLRDVVMPEKKGLKMLKETVRQQTWLDLK